MWFPVGSKHNDAQPQILIDNHRLSRVTKQKYLGVIFDEKLNWSSHVAAICKRMTFCLYQISHHSRSLPSDVLKLLMESLVSSTYLCFTSVGPAVHPDSLLRLNRLHNLALRITCSPQKYDHIRDHHWSIGWLLVSLLIPFVP